MRFLDPAIAAALAMASLTGGGEAETGASAGGELKLWREIDLANYPGVFPCLGDLDNDGRVDFLLCRQGPQTTPAYLVAVDLKGRKLWERGDASIQTHAPDGVWKEPALRGIALVYDIDQDGSSEVITEFWDKGVPLLQILDGATGRVERSVPSPFDLDVRGGKRSRCHPVARIAYLEGKGRPPAIVIKYEASNLVPCHAVALDAALKTLWHVKAGVHAMGHVTSLGDVDGDGRDDLVLGTMLIGSDGTPRWEKETARHADCTAIADLRPEPGKEILMSICGTGPAYCVSAAGAVLWEKTRQEVPHGQGIWAGDFLRDEPGLEVIVLRSGHVGDFVTLRGRDGSQIAAFRQKEAFEGYPDFPHVVAWESQGLWIPIDRTVVDGRGRVLGSLGSHEARVASLLRWGTTKQTLATQALAVDLCGDEREELVLYQPYRGRAIMIFTQPDGAGSEKPYRHQANAYNMHTYF